MFLSVALTRVAPYLIPYDEYADPRLEQQLLERTAALLSVADRETSKLIHTELHSIALDPSQQTNLASSSTARHPTFAHIDPISPSTAAQLLSDLAPEMEQLILETNLKKDSGPLKTAWEAAVARAHARMVEMRAANGDDMEEGEDDVSEHRTQLQSRGSRETTPTPEDPTASRTVTPNGTPAYQRYLTPEPQPPTAYPKTNGTPGTTPFIKQEEEEPSLFGGSGYFVVSPSSGMARGTMPPSTPNGGIPRSMIKSVPQTPGELPSPRPSPSPPPPSVRHGDCRSPSVWQQTQAHVPDYRASVVPARGYFAKGTANEELECREEGAEKIRARSLSC